MTDRVHSVLVVLDQDVRTDDAEHILNALRMVKGVINVEPVISDYNSQMAYARARTDLQARLFEALNSSSK